jgi:putative transposase
LPDNAKIGCGSFSEDSRGRWYINVPVEVAEATQAINMRIGIDLGTKTLATLSNGERTDCLRSCGPGKRNLRPCKGPAKASG